MRPCADRAHVNGSLDERPDKHETLLIPGKCFGILLCPQLKIQIVIPESRYILSVNVNSMLLYEDKGKLWIYLLV